MQAGYSGTPLAKKLGIKGGFKLLLINPPDYYFQLFDDFPNIIPTTEDDSEIDVIHYFVKERQLLKDKLPGIITKLSKQGMLWISWPKKSSKLDAKLDGNIVRETGLKRDW